MEFEKNLFNNNDNGDFGYDTLTLGLPGTGAPAVKDQVVVGIASKDFYIGLWGVGPRPTNLTNLDNPYPSLMTTLKQTGQVPSISYGYTAGARYRKLMLLQKKHTFSSSCHNSELKQVAGSLTLGGYDASRFSPSNTSFRFAGDVSRDLVVGIQSITVAGLNSSKAVPINLLPSPILSFIDAGVSHIWLPLDACNLFESAFGLQYDPFTELYIVNQTTHAALVAQDANITFTIATDTTGTSRVPIVLPYTAFDLQLTTDYPGINETTRYFPIRRAANDTQYTLGRTFLQEAYIIADYERSNFSVNQCTFSESMSEDIHTILPTPSATPSAPSPTPSSTSSHPISKKAEVGIAVAAAVCVLVLCFSVLFIWHRRRRRRRRVKQQQFDQPTKEPLVSELDPGKQAPGELKDSCQRPELGGLPKAELEGLQKARLELQGSSAEHELEQSNNRVLVSQRDPLGSEIEEEPRQPFELPADSGNVRNE